MKKRNLIGKIPATAFTPVSVRIVLRWSGLMSLRGDFP